MYFHMYCSKRARKRVYFSRLIRLYFDSVYICRRRRTHRRSICRKHIRFGTCRRHSVHSVEIPQIENRYDPYRSRFRFDMRPVPHQYRAYRFGIQNALFIQKQRSGGRRDIGRTYLFSFPKRKKRRRAYARQSCQRSRSVYL